MMMMNKGILDDDSGKEARGRFSGWEDPFSGFCFSGHFSGPFMCCYATTRKYEIPNSEVSFQPLITSHFNSWSLWLEEGNGLLCV